MVLYVNWYDQEIITAEQYKERLDKQIEEEMGLYRFSDWLEDNYTATEIFDMDDDTKELAIEEFKEFARNDIEHEFSNNWDEVEVDVDYKYEPIISQIIVAIT